MFFKEDQHTELKENPKSGTIVNEMVAFLNTCDGTIYVGVKNSGEIVGIEDIDEASLLISNVIADKIEPSPRGLIEIDTPIVEGKRILKISVKKGNKLYYVKKYGRSGTGCYERIGTSSRGMTPEQVDKRYKESVTIPEKKMVDTPCNRTDLTFVKFKTYLGARNVHWNDSKFEENFCLLTPDGKYNLIADLLADENMNSIKVAVFKGKDKSDYLKRNEYGFTCLLYAMDQVSEYCLALNETYVDTSTMVRQEKKMFDEDAFREAWVNAVVHNKWVNGIPPAIYWFDDRLEIISYGTMPKGMNKRDFLLGKTVPVNEELMKIFLQCHIVEQTGHGVPKVVKKYGEEAYDFGTSTITVTIPFDRNGFSKKESEEDATKNATKTEQNATKNATKNLEDATKNATINSESETVNAENETVNSESETVNSESETVNCESETVNSESETVNQRNETVNSESETVKLKEIEKVIYKAILENEKITVEELTIIAGKHRSTITRALRKLKDNGVIERVGSDKNGHWKIKE